jgi:hypothetical protein
MKRAGNALLAAGLAVGTLGLILIPLPGPGVPVLLAGASVAAIGLVLWFGGVRRPDRGT